MCRLFMSNKKGIGLLEGTYTTLGMLDYLEKQCGGHGNGYTLIKDNKVLFTRKGVDLKNETIVKVLEKHDYDWFIYHTRVASAGSVKNRNCHPYMNKDKSFVLAMNGTVGNFSTVAKAIDITDTELLFDVYNRANVPLESLVDINCKFIGFKDGKVYASNPTGYGLQYLEKDGAIIIASSFHDDMFDGEVKEMDKMFWWEGEELKGTVKKKYTVLRGSYSNAYYDGFYEESYRVSPSVNTSASVVHVLSSPMSEKDKELAKKLETMLELKEGSIISVDADKYSISVDTISSSYYVSKKKDNTYIVYTFDSKGYYRGTSNIEFKENIGL